MPFALQKTSANDPSAERNRSARVQVFDAHAREARPRQADHLLEVVDADVGVAEAAQQRHAAAAADADVEDRFAGDRRPEPFQQQRLAGIARAFTRGERLQRARPRPGRTVEAVELRGGHRCDPSLHAARRPAPFAPSRVPLSWENRSAVSAPTDPLGSTGAWSFGGETPPGFDDHVSRSIPWYAACHELVGGARRSPRARTRPLLRARLLDRHAHGAARPPARGAGSRSDRSRRRAGHARTRARALRASAQRQLRARATRGARACRGRPCRLLLHPPVRARARAARRARAGCAAHSNRRAC